MNNIVACFVLLFWLGEGKKYQMCTQYGLLMHDQAHWSPPTLILERNFLHQLQLPPARTSVQQIGSRITPFPSDLMDEQQATSFIHKLQTSNPLKLYLVCSCSNFQVLDS
jgi:hypothetical protein